MIDRFFLKKFGFNAVVLLQFIDRGDMPEIFLRNVVELLPNNFFIVFDMLAA